MFFGAGPVEATTTNKALGFVVPAGRERMAGYGSFADVVQALADAVSAGDYLVGDRFSAADIYLGSQIGWGMMFGTIERQPAFERYWTRISKRPAAVRARDIDDSLAAGQKAALVR
jgi:glutathione S-transferase